MPEFRNTENIVVDIVDVEFVIENEIKQGCTQKSIAMTYALALRSSYKTDWKKVNQMIVDRWSQSSLERIKNMAWSGKCFRKQSVEVK